MLMGTDRKLRLLLVTVRPGVISHFTCAKFNSGIECVMACGCIIFALSIYNYSRALHTDSLLMTISSSGMSSTSASLCPFGLKCCGTVSSVLCCMALQCSPNLSRNERFVCPKYSAGVLGDVFALATLYHVNEIFGSTCDHLFFMYYMI